MRIAFCRSNPIAPDPRVEKEARALRQAGHEVVVVGWDRTGELPIDEKLDQVSITRLPIKARFGRGLMNLPQLLRWQWRLLKWLVHNRGAYDVIHACDFDTILPALWLKRWAGKQVVYDIFDFYADHLRATPDSIKELIRRVDFAAINHADAIILVDDSRKGQIAGTRPKRLEVIYNSPEDVLGSFIENPNPRVDGDLHLAYVGLLQVERGLFELLEVLKAHPRWTLDLAGFGGDQARILEQAAGMPNVTWHGRISYAAALELSCHADALIATYDPAIPNHRFSSPNKIFEAMMLAKPVIVACNTNMDRIITEENCGLVIPYGDRDALERALIRLSAEPDLRQNLGKNARQAYETVYSWDHMRSRLLGLYEKIG